ncbi:MAG TPA: gamma-glutamyl-gamma-aminobutyrate hydrolase family protein, partial [Candidatus Binatus sp.]|nr:gamma-glutamyl-gamma-aminobutyrate hydrolase family protein [Candidatus Binatus sp.]
MKKANLPVIGITADLAAEKVQRGKPIRETTLFLAQRYYRAVAQAGGIPVILPPISEPAAIRNS